MMIQINQMMLQLLLVTILWNTFKIKTLSTNPTSPFAWRFYMMENWTRSDGWGNTVPAGSTVLATADCPTSGCSSPIMLNFSDFRAEPNKVDPKLCFLFNQTHYNCKNYWRQKNMGCPYYYYCNIHSARTLRSSDIILDQYKGYKFFKTPIGYTWVVWDPLDPRWTSPVKGAMYMVGIAPWPSSRIYIWRSYIQVQTTVHAEIQQTEARIQSQLSPPQTFSWLSLLQEGLSIINATDLGNISACFLCAALGRPPLTVIPYPTALNTSNDLFPSPPPIFDMSLFPNPLQQQFSFCYYNASTNLYNQTAPPKWPLTAPRRILFLVQWHSF
ncbi:endogenous retrovirus group FC1 Env polyprotein [Suricata suricatta]|uniref:endogenous retrovirus group FC1 Env polyprotein n=1 Tax=Suricata suricatta TaxID=37032 RepID=UPI001155C7BF|nr:endogenous retrovirus group FC1 Env polyprotein [Suricata suricatta]